MALRQVIVAASLALSAGASSTGGHGLTVLSKNDLDGLPVNGTAAILVHEPMSYNAATCAAFGETPWDPDTASSAVLHSNLAYQSFAGRFPTDQRCWVAAPATGADTCRSIDATGRVSPTSCETKLPMLCTQSAPVSSDKFTDNSEPRHIIQPVGNDTRVRGYRDAHSFRFFGLKYAEQPLRFTHSKPAELPKGEISALEPGIACPQKNASPRTTSEDCHFLNIWTPYLPPSSGGDKAQLRPVALYIHGGGFLFGNGSHPSNDFTNMASRGDVVMVALNYRLGSLGFLPFESGTPGGEGSGNYAIGDWVSALQWLHRNIHHFGGDASRLSIFGQSAGATAIHLLLSSPAAQGLFVHASVMTAWASYPFRGTFEPARWPNKAEAMQLGAKAALAYIGCGGVPVAEEIECMRQKDPMVINNFTQGLPTVFTPGFPVPIVDGVYLDIARLPVNTLGRASNISVLTGVTRDEGGKAIDKYPLANDTFQTFAKRALWAYPLAPSVLPPLRPEQFNPDFAAQAAINSTEAILNATIALVSAGEYMCGEHATVYSASASGAFKETYSYVLNRTQMMHNPNSQNPDWLFAVPSPKYPLGDPDNEYFKAHTGEVLPVFGNAARRGLVDRDGKDWAFSRLMLDRWTSFFRTGDPNPDEAWLAVRGYESTLERVRNAPKWETASPAKRTNTMWLQWDSIMTELKEKEGCRALGMPLNIFE